MELRFIIRSAQFLAFFLFPALFSCSDFGLDENFFPTVKGNVHIVSQPPEETDEIVLALVDGLSPKFTRTIPRADLNMETDDQSVTFVIEAKTGKFDGILAIWKMRGQPLSVFENIVGSNCTDNALQTITITEEDQLVEDVQIDVNLRKVNRTARVSGEVLFQGDWPSNIDNLGIVFTDIPTLGDFIINQNVCSLLSNMDIVFLDENEAESKPFDQQVAPGETVIIVAWNEAGGSIFAPKLITPLPFTTITAVADSTISGLEIMARF